jgi:hypothetical protein
MVYNPVTAKRIDSEYNYRCYFRHTGCLASCDKLYNNRDEFWWIDNSYDIDYRESCGAYGVIVFRYISGLYQRRRYNE